MTPWAASARWLQEALQRPHGHGDGMLPPAARNVVAGPLRYDIARKGISSVQLAREPGITRKSAWFLQQRIGAACADHRNPITGEVTAVFRLQPQQRRQDHGGTESSQQGISGQPGYVVP